MLSLFRQLLKIAGVIGVCLGSSMVLSTTLEEVRARGFLKCGVSATLPGFSAQVTPGQWQGMDVDFCRAVAAATLADRERVEFVPLGAKERFSALAQGKVDLLARNTTWNLTRDTSLGVQFVGVFYYDGQGFMARKVLRVRSAVELDEQRICVQSGTTTEQNLKGFLALYGMKAQTLIFDTSALAARAFEAGKCDVLTSDHSQLHAWRARLRDPMSVVVLPEVISKEPLGPLVREGDQQWFNIVKWTLFALINAEELGVSSHNIARLNHSSNLQVQRMLHDDNAQYLGLEPTWAYKIVDQVGNYGELYSRNVGQNSSLQIDRSLNALWSDGGILYAPPFN